MLDILLGEDLICEYVYAPSSCGLRSLSTAFDMSFVLLLQLKSMYEISLRALPPQSYGEFEVYEVAEDTFRRVLEVGSAAFLTEAEVYEAAAGGRLEALKKKIEAIMREREKIRWKPRRLVEEGLEAKLGPLPGEAGGARRGVLRGLRGVPSRRRAAV